MNKTKVAVLGAGFIANIHLESYTRFVNDAEVSEAEFDSYLPDIDGEWKDMFGELLYENMMEKLN